MDQTIYLYVRDGDEIECRQAFDEGRPRGYPELTIRSRGGLFAGLGRVTIFASVGRLQALHAAIGAYLAARREDIDGATDRVDIAPIPAEACTGSEELLETGRRNCPGMVP